MEGGESYFEAYYGWPNKMTWAVFTELGSYEDTYAWLHDIAENHGQEAVKTQVLAWVAGWFAYEQVPHSVDIFMQSVLGTGVDFAKWWKITDSLQGISQLVGDNPFTQVMFDAVTAMDWQAVAAEPTKPDESASIEEQVDYFLSTFDERLKNYCRALLLTWAESRARRQQTPAHILARRIAKIYLDQIVWEKVYTAYKA
jgi:hypothetical protein